MPFQRRKKIVKRASSLGGGREPVWQLESLKPEVVEPNVGDDLQREGVGLTQEDVDRRQKAGERPMQVYCEFSSSRPFRILKVEREIHCGEKG